MKFFRSFRATRSYSMYHEDGSDIPSREDIDIQKDAVGILYAAIIKAKADRNKIWELCEQSANNLENATPERVAKVLEICKSTIFPDLRNMD